MSPAQREAAEREAVAQEALTWLHTPYHHHARIKGVGVDCAQFLAGVFEACGLVPPIDTGFYPVDWHLHRGEERFSSWLARYARLLLDHEPMDVGDVCLFRWGRCFSHGSICVDSDLVVHSYIGAGVVLNRITEAPLDGRVQQRWSFWS